MFIELCGLEYKPLTHEPLLKATFDVKARSWLEESYASNLVRKILLIAKVPIKRAFRFSTQHFLVPEAMIGHDPDVSHWNTQISLQDAFMTIKDQLNRHLLVNPCTLAEYGTDILTQVH